MITEAVEIKVLIELYYKFDPAQFPAFATPAGVGAMLQQALEDHAPFRALQEIEDAVGEAPSDIIISEVSEL